MLVLSEHLLIKVMFLQNIIRVNQSLTWASCGLGIAIIPQSALSLVDNKSLISVILHDEELYTDIVFITRKQDEIDQKTQDFIEQFFHS